MPLDEQSLLDHNIQGQMIIQKLSQTTVAESADVFAHSVIDHHQIGRDCTIERFQRERENELTFPLEK